MALELVSSVKCFNGFQKVFKHVSSELSCAMNFSVYLPNVSGDEKLNTLFYLSGLTCTEQNFIQKSGVQRFASEHRLIIVGPDTSPRGCNLPGETDNWDFGEGAGAYLDAVKEPWSKHYRMFSYVSKELPKLIKENFPTSGKMGIFGHSMGGMGALVIGLRNPEIFSSISAFAPICNPIKSDWGSGKIFKNYLGDENKDSWSLYDPCEVAEAYKGPSREILVDQGTDDEFLTSHLMSGNFKEAASKNPAVNLQLNMREGFGHSYYFIGTFIGDHIAHHVKVLNALQ